MISQEIIHKINSTPIQEIVGDYLSLKRAGSGYTALCPFHDERSPSFMVNVHRNSYKCFGCGAGGGPIRFVMEHDKLPFPDAVRAIGRKIGVDVPEATAKDNKEAALRSRLKEAHSLLAAHYLRCLLHPTIGAKAQRYLRGRKFNSDICKRWGVGYVPEEGNSVIAVLTANKFTPKEIEATGLAYRGERGMMYDKMADRIIFSIRNESGEVIGFSGRTIND